jgi:hypothetical protein
MSGKFMPPHRITRPTGRRTAKTENEFVFVLHVWYFYPHYYLNPRCYPRGQLKPEILAMKTSLLSVFRAFTCLAYSAVAMVGIIKPEKTIFDASDVASDSLSEDPETGVTGGNW